MRCGCGARREQGAAPCLHPGGRWGDPDVPVVLPNLRLASNCRYDLDACDIQEKYPDLFQVSLEVEVEPRERPGHEAPPWEGAGMRGLNPKILFSSREEQQDVLSKFGEIQR